MYLTEVYIYMLNLTDYLPLTDTALVIAFLVIFFTWIIQGIRKGKGKYVADDQVVLGPIWGKITVCALFYWTCSMVRWLLLMFGGAGFFGLLIDTVIVYGLTTIGTIAVALMVEKRPSAFDDFATNGFSIGFWLTNLVVALAIAFAAVGLAESKSQLSIVWQVWNVAAVAVAYLAMLGWRRVDQQRFQERAANAVGNTTPAKLFHDFQAYGVNEYLLMVIVPPFVWRTITGAGNWALLVFAIVVCALVTVLAGRRMSDSEGNLTIMYPTPLGYGVSATASSSNQPASANEQSGDSIEDGEIITSSGFELTPEQILWAQQQIGPDQEQADEQPGGETSTSSQSSGKVKKPKKAKKLKRAD